MFYKLSHFSFAFLGLFLLSPLSVFAGTATITATPNSSPLYTGGTITVTWSSSDTFKCIGTGFNTNNATSGSVQVTTTSSGSKTFTVTCYDDSPACSLVQQWSSVEDAPGPNTCTNMQYSPAPNYSCYPNGAGCQTSTSKGSGTWTIASYQCQGSCSTVSKTSNAVTVTNPPPPPAPSVTLTANPTTVIAGNTTLISWTSNSATSCTGTNFSTGGATSGSVTVTPTANTTYSITCNSTVYSSTPGTYQGPVYEDVTDLWCTSGPPAPNYSNYYTNNECPDSSPVGDPCVGSEECFVNWWSGGGGPNTYCNLRTEAYRCNGGSAPNTITDSVAVVYNQRPAAPTITGPTTGTVGVANSFTFKAADPDNNQVRYRLDWNSDGTYDQTSSYGASNWSFATSYTWNTAGTYTFQARTNDNLGAYSLSPTWGTHTITIGNPTPQCSDGIDNDDDGLIDLADYGCPDGNDNNESDNPQCSDGINNDADAWIDYPNDPGCSSYTDNDESNNTQCSDGIDNNGNGLVDLADTAACSDIFDGIEEPLPDADLSLVSTPGVTQKNAPVILSWTANNTQNGSCTLTGSNGDSWNLSGSSGSQTTSGLIQETIYTLSCDDLNDTPVATSITIKLVPSFQEI